MLAVVKLSGFLVIAIGTIFSLKPEAIINYLAFWKRGKRIYIIALFRLVMGAVFLAAASDARSTGNLMIIGIIASAGSFLVILAGKERVFTVLDTFARGSIMYHRLMAVVAAYFGTLIICSA